MLASPESSSSLELGLVLARRERAWLAGAGEAAFRGGHTRAYRADPALRARIFAEALEALRAFSRGSDRAWHEADWLRCHACLWFDLEPGALEQALALERRVLAVHEPQSLPAFEALQARLGAAFEGLAKLDALAPGLPGNHETLDGSEAYWNACARLAPLVTIDWACFDREDLFEENGRRAAEWLLAEGGIRPEHSVLQIGCGIGRIERYLSGRVASVTGVDVSREMIERGRARLAGSSVALLQSDGLSTGLPDASVDRAFAALVFIHIHAPETRAALIRDVHRTLRAGGRFWLSLDEFRLGQEGGADATDRAVREAACDAGFRSVERSRVSSRAINSFGFEWDWRWELVK